jgi:hypothetical protein
MPSISVPTVRSTRTTAEQSTLGPTTTRTASRNTDGAADAGRPRVPEAAKAAGRESGSGRSGGGSGVGRVPAGTTGLVICAENVRDPLQGGIAVSDMRAVDALGLRFPSPEMVATAAALFEPAAPWACGLNAEAPNLNPDAFVSLSGLASCDPGGPTPSGPRKPPNGPSVITNVTFHARPVAAQMIDRQPSRDRPVYTLIGEAMRVSGTVAVPEDWQRAIFETCGIPWARRDTSEPVPSPRDCRSLDAI